MKDAVLEHIIHEGLHYESCGVASIGQIARKFGVKKNEARKHIAELIKEGAIEYAVAPGGWTEDGPYPPLKGYKVTEKTMQTVLYKHLNQKAIDGFAKLCY